MQNIDDLIRSLERDDEKPSDLPKNSIEDDIKREQLRSISQDIDERKLYARYTYGFLCVYMALVFLVLFLCGWSLFGFTLSDTVLVALIATTTANVISIFAFVVRYLFHSKQK